MSRNSMLGIVTLMLVLAGGTTSPAADAVVPDVLDPRPFGDDFPGLDSWATGQWWTKASASPAAAQAARQRNQQVQKKRRGAAVPRALVGRGPRGDDMRLFVLRSLRHRSISSTSARSRSALPRSLLNADRSFVAPMQANRG